MLPVASDIAGQAIISACCNGEGRANYPKDRASCCICEEVLRDCTGKIGPFGGPGDLNGTVAAGATHML